MDWSFLQRHSKHKLLRSDLIYSNNPAVRYFCFYFYFDKATQFDWDLLFRNRESYWSQSI